MTATPTTLSIGRRALYIVTGIGIIYIFIVNMPVPTGLNVQQVKRAVCLFCMRGLRKQFAL